MKQIIQNYRSGRLELADVPIPSCASNNMLVKNAASLVSLGTERSILELGKKSLLGKARARPDLAKRFMDKAKNEGFVKTFKEAMGRLDNPTPLGYSSAGIVVEVGERVKEFCPGDRVACIGAGYACHAEYISIPPMLGCKIPDSVSFEEASFGMLGIIALHGIRSANLGLGSSAVVIGLGLLGLLSVQLLRAYGCYQICFGVESADEQILKNKPTIATGKTSLREFLALLEKSDLFIGVDSGPVHMAAAKGTKVIALFGAARPEAVGPNGDAHIVVTKQDDFSCSPCAQTICKKPDGSCMKAITVDDVWNACQIQINRILIEKNERNYYEDSIH